MSLKRIVLGAAMAAALVSPAAAATINFDEAQAPSLFDNQVTLGGQYAAQGVTFSGLGGAGGEVLDQSSGFGLNAHSGRNFLAFNTAMTAGGERLDFTSAIGAFEVFVGSGGGANFWANAYDSLGGLVSSTNISLGQGVWWALSLSGAGITRVQFGSNAGAWVADDLSFSAGPSSAVPEPGVWAMMITGFGLVGAARRCVGAGRRRRSRPEALEEGAAPSFRKCSSFVLDFAPWRETLKASHLLTWGRDARGYEPGARRRGQGGVRAVHAGAGARDLRAAGGRRERARLVL